LEEKITGKEKNQSMGVPGKKLNGAHRAEQGGKNERSNRVRKMDYKDYLGIIIISSKTVRR